MPRKKKNDELVEIEKKVAKKKKTTKATKKSSDKAKTATKAKATTKKAASKPSVKKATATKAKTTKAKATKKVEKAEVKKVATKKTATKKPATTKKAASKPSTKKATATKVKATKKVEKAKVEKVATKKTATKKPVAKVKKTTKASDKKVETTKKTKAPIAKYSDNELVEFKGRIAELRKEAIEELRMLRERLDDLTNYDFAEESMIYSMHMAEQGSEALEKEKTYAQIQRINEYIKKLDEALKRIIDKSYGICRACDCLIAKERLWAVPITTLSASYKIHQKCPDDGIDRIEPIGR